VNKMTKFYSAIFLGIAFSTAIASTSVTATNASHMSNSQQEHNAKQLISQTRPRGHYSCAECHGIDGNPPITDKYNKQSPTLAGQNADYLTRQLLAFKTGTRYTDEMKDILLDYTDTELKEIANYFSQQVLFIDPNLDPSIDTLVHSKDEDEVWVIKGKKLYETGDSTRGIASCQSCHGPLGKGNSEIQAPQLTAQHARYVRMTLKAYQEGTRTTDAAIGGQMQASTQALTNNDITELAAYIQSMNTAP